MELTPAETAEILASDEGIALVDCREQDEFEFNRLPGAEHLPLSRFPIEVEEKLKGREEDGIIVYCHHGVRSLQAAEYLVRLGFKNVRSMSGGIDLWSQIVDAAVPRY